MKQERETQAEGSFIARKHPFLDVTYKISPDSALLVSIQEGLEQRCPMLPDTHPFVGDGYLAWIDPQGILNSVIEGEVKKVPFPQGTTFEAFPEFIVAKNQYGSGGKKTQSLIRFIPGFHASPLLRADYEAMDKSRML